MIKGITPLWCAIKKLHIQDIVNQSSQLCKKGEKSSVLRAGSKCYDEIKDFKWQVILTELLDKAPDIADILFAIASPKPLKSKERADSIIPPLCLAWSILMNVHNNELSLVQKTLTCILGVSGCNKAVSTQSFSKSSYTLKLKLYNCKLKNILV